MTDPPGEHAPFVSVVHRNHGARLGTVFCLGFLAGAGTAWVVILALALAGRTVG